MLKDIHYLMRNHEKSGVRAKFLGTWDFYIRRYPSLMRGLERGGFTPSVISPEFDWSDACSRVLEGHRGFGIEVPDINDLEATIKTAREAGRKAAMRKHKEFCNNPNSCSGHFPCGGGFIILDVDGRNKIGRFLKSIGDTIKGVSITNDLDGKGFHVCIRGMHNRQEKAISVAASEAALNILQKRLGVYGYVQVYYD